MWVWSFCNRMRNARYLPKSGVMLRVQIEQRPDLLRPAVGLLRRWTWVSGKGLAKEVGKAALDERLMKKIEVTTGSDNCALNKPRALICKSALGAEHTAGITLGPLVRKQRSIL